MEQSLSQVIRVGIHKTMMISYVNEELCKGRGLSIIFGCVGMSKDPKDREDERMWIISAWRDGYF